MKGKYPPAVPVPDSWPSRLNNAIARLMKIEAKLQAKIDAFPEAPDIEDLRKLLREVQKLIETLTIGDHDHNTIDDINAGKWPRVNLD